MGNAGVFSGFSGMRCVKKRGGIKDGACSTTGGGGHLNWWFSFVVSHNREVGMIGNPLICPGVITDRHEVVRDVWSYDRREGNGGVCTCYYTNVEDGNSDESGASFFTFLVAACNGSGWYAKFCCF